MVNQSKTVDGFCFMPPSLRAWIMKNIPEEDFNLFIKPFISKNCLLKIRESLETN